MKKIIFAALVLSLAACSNSETSAERTEQMPTRTDSANGNNAYGNAPGVTSSADTTSTSNNNAYNTDSASGQSTTFDTAAQRRSGGQQ